MSDLKSAIYGLAIGDALGVPFEFMNRDSFTCTDMKGHGTHNQPLGTWSDDTSMTIATCASIKKNHKIDIEDIRNRFNDWIFKNKYTATGETFDYGMTTLKALRSGIGQKDVNSNGNGSLMRILPLAFIDVSDEEIDDVSSITHAHEISKEACRLYIKIAKELLSGKDLESILYDLHVSDVYSRLKYLRSIKKESIKSSGYVVDTLEASLWCLLHSDSYKEAVLMAVNLGDDTDTVGAVTGGLAGIIYDYENMPSEWIDSLLNKNIIDKCLF